MHLVTSKFIFRKSLNQYFYCKLTCFIYNILQTANFSRSRSKDDGNMSEDQANLHKLLSNGYTSCDERGLGMKGRSRRSGPRKLKHFLCLSSADVRGDSHITAVLFKH